MYETLSERFVDVQAHSVSEPECADEVPEPLREQAKVEHPHRDATTDSFLDLLGDFERHPVTGDRSHIIAGYRAWIDRNSTASSALYAAWFNLAVELAAGHDKAGATTAYQNVLAFRPGFYPAAINLGTLMEAIGQPEAALAAWQQGLQPDEERAALLEYRKRLAEAHRIEQQNMPAVLHVGCGASGHKQLPSVFLPTGWREIRMDMEPDVHPDFIAGLTDMTGISDGLVDAVYSSDPIEHLYPHEVVPALQEMWRVLKPTGFALIRLPDLQEIARHVAEGKLEEALYMSPVGPIAPLDMLYGHRPSLAAGNAFSAPRTGFTSTTLAAVLIKAGFGAVMLQRDLSAFRLTAVAFRSRPDQEQLARAQAQMFASAGHPAVLYTPAA